MPLPSTTDFIYILYLVCTNGLTSYGNLPELKSQMKPARITIKDFSHSTLIHSTEYLTEIEVGYSANCHGYTISGEHTLTSNWQDVIEYSDKLEDKKILVYTYKHNVSHSGRIEEGALIHYIKRVGLVSTPLAIARLIRTEYKDDTFMLPTERAQFNQHMIKQRSLTNFHS